MAKIQKHKRLYLTCLVMLLTVGAGLGYWNYRQNAQAYASAKSNAPTNFDQCVAASNPKSSSATLDSTNSKLVCSWWNGARATSEEFMANPLPDVRTVSAAVTNPDWSDAPALLKSEVLAKSAKNCQFRHVTLTSTGDASIQMRLVGDHAIVSVGCDGNYFYMYHLDQATGNWVEITDTGNYTTCEKVAANKIPVEIINFDFNSRPSGPSKYATCLDEKRIPHKVVVS